MIQKLEITGVHMKVDDKLRAYAIKKIGRLDRFIPRKAREAVHAEVLLKDDPKKKDKKEYTCEVVIHLPQDTITVQEATINSYAAIDIVENKLKNLLTKYKEKHNVKRLHRRVLSRLRRQNPNV